MAMTTVTFGAPGLGDRSYLIGDGEVGAVIDPQKDPFPYLQEAERLGIGISAVFETHVHNDYVSGGLALAQSTSACYAIPAGEPVSFSDEFRALHDGDTVVAGRLEVTAIATAGHTAHHLSYLVQLAGGEEDASTREHVVCTGGSLLVNATGRTDLLGLPLASTLAHSQWHSVRRLLTTLPNHARILPTHGFGSFCSATPTHGDVTGVTTIGQELEQNPAALLDEVDRRDVARRPAADPGAPPPYGSVEPQGPGRAQLRTRPRARRRSPRGRDPGAEWGALDLRHRRAFAAGHLPGALNLELGANLTTYLGWIVPWESDLVLLANDDAEIAEARRLIARIGRDDLSGTALWATAVSAPDQLASRRQPAEQSIRWQASRTLLRHGPGPSRPGPRCWMSGHRHEWQAGHLRRCSSPGAARADRAQS